MAILRTAYLEHLRGVLRRILLNPVDAQPFVQMLMRAGVEYVKAGSAGAERAARRETLHALITLAKQLRGEAHIPHNLKHELVVAGVVAEDAEDVPQVSEPIV